MCVREREGERDSFNLNGLFDLSECSYQHTRVGGGGGERCMFNCMYKRTVHKRFGISHVMKQSWLKFCVISWWFPLFSYLYN